MRDLPFLLESFVDIDVANNIWPRVIQKSMSAETLNAHSKGNDLVKNGKGTGSIQCYSVTSDRLGLQGE